jgi:hypothetical protein
LGRDTNVYSASRWSVGLLILAAGGVGLCAFLFYPLLDAYIRSVHLRRTFGFIRFVSPDVTIWSVRAVAACLIAVSLAFSRMFINPRVVSVDTNGIEVRHLFSVDRGRWKDFASMRAIGRHGMGTVQLFFRKAAGSSPRVTLPPRVLGVDLKAVVADISVFVMEPQKVPEGSLDKYDPKKLARQAAAAAPPEDDTEVPELVTVRRSFGKRAVTSG